MEGLLVFGLFVAVLALIDSLAYSHGVDSRPEFIDPRLPVRPAI